LPEVSWLFFQGANEDSYLTDTGRESNAEKQPTGSGPEGCDENGKTLIGPIFDADECRKSKTFISGLCWVYSCESTRHGPKPAPKVS
jgi:hypothetical protein